MKIRFNKKSAVFVLFLLIFCSFGWQIFSQEKLEFNYPDIPKVQKPTSAYTPITVYVKYIYNFFVLMAGSLTFILFILGGIKYLSSAGRPDAMVAARNQITKALLGFIIILSSHLFLRTINPKLVQFPSFSPFNITNEKINPLEDLEKIKYYLIEVPVGTLITKEYTASSFIVSGGEDPSCDSPQYEDAFPDTEEYPGDFQGGLHGRRLKRINEVGKMATALAKKMMELIDQLKQLTDRCHCLNCKCQENCTPSGPLTCENRSVSYGEICTEDTKERIICQKYLIEYFSGAYKAFLDDYSELVKNEEYSGNSYWHSAKAVELRAKIKQCQTKGKITQEEIDAIEKLIDAASKVENKGTRSPKTTPPERDVQTNIFHLEAMLKSLLDLKENINPYNDNFGSLEFLSWHGMIKLQALTQLTEKKTRAGSSGNATTIPYVVNQYRVNQEVKASEDPALFYTFFKEAGNPSVMSYDNSLNNKKPSFISEVLANDSEESLQTKTKCSRLVEIPIGRAIDEALKLMEDILKELKNIWDNGHRQIKNGEEMGRLADLLIIKESCKIYCETTCTCVEPCPPPLPPPPPDQPQPDEDPPCHDCLKCHGECVPNAALDAIKRRIDELNKDTKAAYESIKLSSEKINSEKPINKDDCCNDKLGNCRNEEKKLISGKITEQKYSVKCKLAKIQKLLNRSREVINLNREKNEGKSVYELLIKQLMPINSPLDKTKRLADQKEITNLLADEKLDLTNCDVLYAESQAIEQSKEEQKNIFNCKIAKGEISDFLPDAIRADDNEVCSPDPLLDCDYFNPIKTRKKRPFSCYCFDEDISEKGYGEIYIPPPGNLANNLYCCVIPYEGY